MIGGGVLNQSHKGGAHGYLLSKPRCFVRSQVEGMKRPNLYLCVTSKDDSSQLTLPRFVQ